MSKFTKFLTNIGINTVFVEVIGGRLVGILSGLNSTNAGGYMNPNVIDGYSYNPSNDQWYAPSIFDGTFDFNNPASPEKKAELDQARYWRDLNNRVEGVAPGQGDAGDLNSPSLWDLLRKMPEIIDRYREIAPDIWRDLKDYISPPIDFPPDGIDPTTDTSGARGGTTASRTKTGVATASTTRSPLVLDLDGDGVETTGVTNGTNFDHDHNGFAEATGWVGQDDGLLVLDRNGNGQIDDGSELFGNGAQLDNGQGAANVRPLRDKRHRDFRQGNSYQLVSGQPIPRRAVQDQ